MKHGFRDIPFPLLLRWVVAEKITGRLVCSSPEHAGVIMIDVVQGSVVQVTGTWGSGTREIQRLLSWKRGDVLIRPLPGNLASFYPSRGNDCVTVDPDFLNRRSDHPDDPAGLILFWNAVKTLQGVDFLLVWDSRSALWREDLFFPPVSADNASPFGGENLQSLQPLVLFAVRRQMLFLRVRTRTRTLLISRHFPGFSVLILGGPDMNPALVRAYLRLVKREREHGNGELG